MKKIKIFSFPSHQTKERTSGVDMARIIQPSKHLNGYKDKDVEFQVDLFDINKKTDWLHVAKNYDAIYFNYLPSAWGYAAMGAMARKHGVKLVLDLDDDLWDIRKDNTAYTAYHKGSEALINFSCICDDVDYITTTSSYLRNVITHNTYKTHDKIKVFPNYVDLELYKYKPPFKDTTEIQIGYFGSTSHFIDLQEEEFEKGINKIMRDYPNVILKTVGAFIPRYKHKWGQRYEHGFGDVDIYRWISDKFPLFIKECDFFAVPLSEDTYNRCKSPIKWLEISSAGKPAVWQDIRQYKEVVNGTNGLLAHNADDWYNQIKKLIDDKDLRQKMGEKAYQDVKKDWTIQNHVKDYAEFFKSIVKTT